jgi:4-amino-4-deoxy-L-arabinose transferase-like glycosyltransferase
MTDIEIVTKYLPLFISLAVLQYGLQIFALIDLTNHDVRGKKWAWIIVIVLGELLGPIVYFLFGKKRA